jgi:hypothetical protein
MEPDYLAIDKIIQVARQHRSEQLGVLISAGLTWCTALLNRVIRPQTSLWRVLPP